MIMSFGLCSVPATFERLMEIALRGLAYLDDIMLMGRPFQPERRFDKN